MPPLRLAVARLTHDHVHGLLGRAGGDVEIVGVYEPDAGLARRVLDRHGLDGRLLHTDALGAMLDALRPDAVAAFGSTREHLAVVEAAAPRGVHGIVEKPLAADAASARAMAALARRHGVHLLTNYETTAYPSVHAAHRLFADGALGPLRRLVFQHGHHGPREVGAGPEFLAWLTDPDEAGGALMDFACYGASLATWLAGGAPPLAVTAVAQQLRPDAYPHVEDDATLVLAYPTFQAVIQASWNWPTNRKSLEVYGATGYALAPDATTLRVRTDEASPETVHTLAPRPAPHGDPFALLAAVVRGTVAAAPAEPPALHNNLTTARILDAARASARTGRTVRFD